MGTESASRGDLLNAVVMGGRRGGKTERALALEPRGSGRKYMSQNAAVMQGRHGDEAMIVRAKQRTGSGSRGAHQDAVVARAMA